MEYNFKAHFIRDPLKSKSDNWQDTAHKWLVSINGQDFEYYTGLAHRKEVRKGHRGRIGNYTYDEMARMNLTEAGFKQLLELSKPTPPTPDDVLYCLVSDAEAAETTFAEWCNNFGYDTDSRKALAIYEQCQQNTDKLRKAGINIAAERERLQDY